MSVTTVSYVLNCVKSLCSLCRIQLSIAVLIKHFRENVVSIADVAIAIEVKTDIGHAFLLPDDVELGLCLARIRPRLAAPPVRHFNLVFKD